MFCPRRRSFYTRLSILGHLVGGFDLAAEWMGWDNVFHCEYNDFGKRVLKYYWPKAISYGDIKQTDFTIHKGEIDILTGGFPCQPFSTAGKRKGTEDDRHLWPEMLRAIREIAPHYIVGENVYGLVNWDGGLVFDQVQADLEAQGYEVAPVILPAVSVNAPHKRDRIWFVAHSKGNSCGDAARNEKHGTQEISKKRPDEFKPSTNAQQHGLCNDAEQEGQQSGSGRQARGELTPLINGGATPNTNTNSQRHPRQEYREKRSGQHSKTYTGCGWKNFPTQSPVLCRNDGLSSELDGITFPKWRNESIKAYGNAIVPQVAYQIFKAIESHDRT